MLLSVHELQNVLVKRTATIQKREYSYGCVRQSLRATKRANHAVKYVRACASIRSTILRFLLDSAFPRKAISASGRAQYAATFRMHQAMRAMFVVDRTASSPSNGVAERSQVRRIASCIVARLWILFAGS